MPSRAATLPDVRAFDARACAGRDYRRTIFGGAVVGLGSVSAVALMAGTVAVAAAWMVSGSLARNPAFRARAPFALEQAVLPAPPQRLADPADMFGGALAAANPAYAPEAMPEAEPMPQAAASPPLPLNAPRPASRQRAELINDVPLPPPRPLHLASRQAQPARMAPAPARAIMPPAFIMPPAVIAPREIHVERSAARTAQQRSQTHAQRQMAALVAASAAAETTGSIGPVAKPAALPRLAYNNPETPPLREPRTAIYDIVAHTVYLPDGERLEAHSGLGRMLDDPRYVSAKGRGPTPPNTYDLTLRSGLFHGVQALRLNPVADSRMYGRDGILAHTYMLGPSGQSFGCVSFKDYSEFLRAFERGEVTRLVVVPHLPSPPPVARARRDGGNRYAFDLESVH